MYSENYYSFIYVLLCRITIINAMKGEKSSLLVVCGMIPF